MSDLFKNILPDSTDYDEESIKEAIRQRVAHLLDTQPELLMSYLYRLDVLEKDLKAALNTPAQINIVDAFSNLIWQRQKARIATRAKYKQDPIDNWEDEL